jgi:hypothetical protein
VKYLSLERPLQALCPKGQVGPLHDWAQRRDDYWLFGPGDVTYQEIRFLLMAELCHISGCKHDVPAALSEHKLCILHFTLSLEAGCAEMRRETALGNAPYERQREIMRFITENGERLARVATSGLHLTDDLKARVLSTFLTLMNLRENLDRAALRTPPGRTGVLR